MTHNLGYPYNFRNENENLSFKKRRKFKRILMPTLIGLLIISPLPSVSFDENSQLLLELA